MGIGTDNGGAVFTNNYYLADGNLAPGGGVFPVVAAKETAYRKTSDEMKAAAFVGLLGAAYKADSKGINDGYPVLSGDTRETLPTTVRITFRVTPENAEIEVKLGGMVVEPTANSKVYVLDREKTYDYTISAENYVTKTGSVTVSGNATVTVALVTTLPTITKTALNAAIAAADKLAKNEYTDASWAAVTAALAAAKAVAANANATQEQVDAAVDTLNAAIDALVEKSPAVAEDKAALNAAITAAEKLAQADYTDASWAALETALAEAKAVAANADATQAQADAAASALNAAVRALAKKTSPEPKPAPWVNPFKDVKSGDWFYSAVQFVNETGLMNGTADDTFDPALELTRAMLVTILYRYENPKTAGAASKFADVPAGQWYSDAIAWANVNGIVTGYSATEFGPNDNITREQLATILYRYAQKKGVDVSKAADLSAFSDANEISNYALAAIKWANAAGLVNGRTATELAPRGTATRAEAATVLSRFVQGLGK
jgi:hypothetical protein